MFVERVERKKGNRPKEKEKVKPTVLTGNQAACLDAVQNTSIVDKVMKREDNGHDFDEEKAKRVTNKHGGCFPSGVRNILKSNLPARASSTLRMNYKKR